MIVIHYPTAYKALDCFIDLYNSKVVKNTDKLKAGAVLTAKEIIRIYGIALLKTNGYQDVNAEDLPSLQTNNRQLAKLVKCSVRTIQRHIIKLQVAGIITGKKFHGSNTNYELWINPRILLVKQRFNVDNIKQQLNEALTIAKQNSRESSLPGLSTTKCPHTYLGNTGNSFNNILITVDKPLESSQPFAETGTGYTTGHRTRYTGEIAENFIEQKNPKGLKDTGEIASRAELPGHLNVATDPARDNSLTFYVSLFWVMARNLLYKQVDLTEHQVLIAKKLIRQLYEPALTENLSRIHQHYIARIALVSKYLRRDPQHRYVTLPYLYFDTQNAKGFVATKQWYKADLARKKEVERELILSRLIRKYQNNLKQDPVKRQPVLQLYRECENTIGKFNDPDLTDRFHAAVLQHETYKQIRFPFKN